MSIRTKNGLLYEIFGKVHVYFPSNAFKQSNQNDEIAYINAYVYYICNKIKIDWHLCCNMV